MLYQIRSKNLSILRKNGFKVNDNLPFVEDDITPQSVNAIADRIDVLNILYTISIEGNDSKDFFFNMLKKNNLLESLSKNEYNALCKKDLSSQNMIDFSWSKEAIYALLWASGLAKGLSSNLEEIDISDFYSLIPPEKIKKDFIASIVIKSNSELLEMIDFYYNLHWSIKHSQTTENKLSIIMERRRAIEWCAYAYDWDDIILDT